ncbi:hypothetical protein F6X40_09550 [Paraburkholderia sp. UCT31]|uniref:hypothetical protein n=1 Tax=Paraburkholderia sp. UCT31 TaxID=2615209 RepID=UPI0016560569|nr:hypothetical protein [Paraburkholderia sp. UCT31]MBC8737053.1 hypothetical protein [Paraburkholderia sp. UCT31]
MNYLLPQFEVWELPGGPARGLRITTDCVVPFASSALLKVSVDATGVVTFEDSGSGDTLGLAEPLDASALEVFAVCAALYQPVLLSEMYLPRAPAQPEVRTWLAMVA